MTFLNNINQTLSVFLKAIIIFLLLVFIGYLGLSVWGNATEGRSQVADMPSIRSAPYMFKMATTGQVILTKTYDTLQEGKYLLHGFYDLGNGKWQFSKYDLMLDSFYWGKITVEKRTR